ncbi:unnamed protein product [Prunus armeniaca]|uniref:GAG-pre-integrase domain-containing protein n=1 Tax=Prunus armeniaca TaxID=36596 RepID=A0A6J5XRS8_PRUAR|nr:unnamed protein product [Prunus armeniaca]
MHEHLNDYNKILVDLANLHVKIPDEDKTLYLLNSLLDDYDHVTTTLLYGKFEGKLDEVSAALVNHECRKKELKTQNSQIKALVARDQTEERKSRKEGKSRSKLRGKFPAKDEYAFCGQKGHWKKDCPKLKNKEREKVGYESNFAKSGDDNFEFALASSSVNGHSKEWILDSDMKKNLISLGALESKGLKITMDSGVLKAVYGTRVVMKCIRLNNLYFLSGSTIIGRAVVTKATYADITDTMRLWHMRIGHAGEKALQGLVKQGLLKGAKACKLEFCEHCVLGKQTRVKFGTAIHHTNDILDYVHTDVWGHSKNASWGVAIILSPLLMTSLEEYGCTP